LPPRLLLVLLRRWSSSVVITMAVEAEIHVQKSELHKKLKKSNLNIVPAERPPSNWNWRLQ
jgi:hypothetical protein